MIDPNTLIEAGVDPDDVDWLAGYTDRRAQRHALGVLIGLWVVGVLALPVTVPVCLVFAVREAARRRRHA